MDVEINTVYTYDANKNKLTETLGAPMANYGFSTTSYDAENRLTTWSRSDGNQNQSWNLSLAGDWNTFTENGTPQARTHNAVHEVLTAGSMTLGHDANGNLTSVTGYPVQGVWDFDNRLLSAT
ncbi:MAG: hypothetical protein ABFC77_14420, partial [Thermoguttaceae bacterium]